MKLILLLLVVFTLSNVGGLSPLEYTLDLLKTGEVEGINFGAWANTIGQKVISYQQLAKDGHSLLGFERELGSLWQNPLTCEVCKVTLGVFDFLVDTVVVRDALEAGVSMVCGYYMQSEVCQGAIKAMGDVVFPQILEFIIAPEYGCSRLAGVCNYPKWKTLDSQDYIDNILKDKPEFLKNNDFVNMEYKKINSDAKNRNTIKVLHITDLHLDFDYMEGSNVNCGEPLCCRNHNGPAPTPESGAGKYGTAASCDLPPITAHLMFDYIRDMPDQPDLVFWTGDNIAHDIWNQTAHKNAEYTIEITNWIKTHLAEVPVFPSPGNHEFFPVNVMQFEGVHPVLDQLGLVWKDWLDEQAYEDFTKYGYYSMPLKGVKESWKGFRVIALNTEACNDQNWYLFTQDSDPGNHLAWLENEFKKMDQNGERAYIIGHVQPGGGSCLHDWSVRYRALIERYQHLVIVHLFGHSHGEFFNVFTDSTNSSAINTLHGPGSVTTYSNHFPMFRIYDIDAETGYPVKAHKYWFNLTEANLGNPKWEYAYELTEEYKMEDLSPQSFKNLAENFIVDSDLATQYHWNQGARAFPRAQSICTSESCRKSTYCSTANIIEFERKDCNGIPRIDFNGDLVDGLYNIFFDPWVQRIS